MIAFSKDEQAIWQSFVSKEFAKPSNGVQVLTSNSVVDRHDPNVRQRVYAMYAIKLTTDVYHLVQRGGQHTLCGLRLTRIISERNAGRLQMVDEVPLEKKVCKHCERIRSQDAGE